LEKELLLKLEQIVESVSLGKSHLEHPEDLVFLGGISGAKQALAAMQQTVANPDNITLKLDGYPALIFGNGSDGRFSIMDKHMFNKKDGSGRQVFSPADFANYDKNRNVDRPELHKIIELIWNGLKKECDNQPGYYWGDLLFHQPLTDNKGTYTFKANPNGLTYTVRVNSDIGKLLTGKTAGIAIHQYLSANAISVNEAKSLNGSLGNLINNSNVALLPSKLPIVPELILDANLTKKLQQDISQYQSAVDQLINTSPMASKAFSGLFTVFVNKKIVTGNLSKLYGDFFEFIQNRNMSSEGMKQKIIQHLSDNKQGVIGIFQIWTDLYNIKMNLVKQLDKSMKSSPIKGFLDDGTESHEGFVSDGVKYVNRTGFAAQNLSKK